MAERNPTALFLVALVFVLAQAMRGALSGPEVTVTGHVVIRQDSARQKAVIPVNAVIWLMPIGASPAQPARVNVEASPRRFKLIQKSKRFDPRILVVPVGSVVDFPNDDPLFHNVFSLFEGKRFDLGLYETGSTRAVAFDRPGICYTFCNIHPEMSAVVIVQATPYFAVADRTGAISIPKVPTGRYRLQVWHERCTPENSSLGTVQLVVAAELPLSHKNKYGRDYDTPEPPSPLYQP